MQGDAAVIELLNDVLTAELTAINQYFIDAKMCANWGYDRLAEHIRDESIDEMKDADELIERILYLDGVPNLQRLGTRPGGRDGAREAHPRPRPRDGGHRPPQRRASSCASGRRQRQPRAARGASSSARRSTPTGSRPSSLIESVGVENYLTQQLHDDE